jgi:signal transduction histidine kinase
VAINLEQMHDEVHSERLMRAVESTKRLERYIDAARKQLQHQSESSEFALSTEITAAIEFLGPQAMAAGVQVDLIKLDNPRIFGNPIKFHQMVTNLIANAVSAYDGGRRPDKRRIAIELWRVDDFAQLTVRDWGAGISAEHLDKIFDPFFTLKKSDQGIGIGLSLSKSIVEDEFGGTIDVVSDEKSGTTFTVRIPIDPKHKNAKTTR